MSPELRKYDSLPIEKFVISKTPDVQELPPPLQRAKIRTDSDGVSFYIQWKSTPIGAPFDCH